LAGEEVDYPLLEIGNLRAIGPHVCDIVSFYCFNHKKLTFFPQPVKSRVRKQNNVAQTDSIEFFYLFFQDDDDY
jgi:hypothetical protein